MSESAIHFPHADVRALFAQMGRAQKELGRDMGQALKFAGWSVARSLGVQTKVAPKYRDYTAMKESRREVARHGGRKKYEVVSLKKGRRKAFTVRAESVAKLKQMSQVRIGKAGLAKAAWMWGIKKLGSGGGFSMKGATASAKQFGRENMDVTSRLTGNDPFISITNSLPYASAALKGGMSAVTGAMGKAARSMEQIITAKAAKKLGAK